MFISMAYAQAAPAAQASTEQTLMGMLPLILMFVVLYFLMIRPQMKKAKEHRTMLEALGKGDEVVTSGGVLGRIVKVGDTYITLDLSANETGPEIQVQKQAIQVLLPKGTLKSL